MKVFLNSNFEIENISNESGDPIVRGSDKFNKLHIFVPTSTVNSYNTISPLYSVKRADGRILGNYATITTHDNTEAFNGYYGWKGDFNPRDIAVAGALELTISFKMKKTAASVEMTKVVAKITLEVKDAAVALDDVLVLGDGGAWTSLSDSIASLTSNLGAKADLNNNQQNIVAAKFTATSFKKGDNELATETQVSEEATARQQADNALQADINTRVKIADIINALNDTSTNKPLSAYQGKLLKDAIDGINNLLQSDDTNLDELQEIVTYIKNNKSLIDGITSSKISYTDIVDNLTSELANKPLSAKQGYILKGLIDTLQTAVNNRYTKSETDTLLNGKADKSTTYTKTQVNNLLSGKQDITIPTITIAGVEYTNLEAAISAINDYAETIEQVIGSISGSDTTIATRLTQLESSVSSLNSAWTTFTTGTSADNIINTLVEIQNKFKEFNIIYLPDNATSGHLSNNTVNKITSRTLVVYEGKVFTLSEIGDDYYYFSSNSGDDTTCDLAYLYIENNPNNDEEQNYHIDFVSGEIKRNKVTSWSQNPSNENYPSEKLVKDSLDSETTRATAQENKSLYHLGAFDSADGKTRQTGFIDEDYILKNYLSQYSTSDCYYLEVKVADGRDVIVSNKSIPYVESWSFTSTHYYRSGSNNYINLFVMKTDLPNIQIQYKLATSYTDTPIENESILPLDSNMAQMIRQDVVEGLNLCSSFVNATNYQANAYAKLKPNTTYFFSSDDSTAVNVTFKIYDLNGNLLQTVWTNRYSNQVTLSAFEFTTDSNVNGNVRLQFGVNIKTSSMTWAMLNSGSHPYPHSDYHANKHITDEEATLLKRETVKCRNLVYETNIVKVDNYNITLGKAKVKAGQTYYLNIYKTLSGGEQSKVYINNVEVGSGWWFNGKGSFVAPNDLDGVIKLGATFTNTSLPTQVMLNEGSEAQPYSEYYGELVHKKELPHLYLHHLKVESMEYATFEFTILSPYSFTITDFSDLFFVLSTYTGGLNKKVVVGMVKLEVNDTDHDRILFHEPEEADIDANTSDLEITDNKVTLF